MSDREQAIKDFVSRSSLEESLGLVLKGVAQQNPNAVMVLWETDEGYFAASVPHSRALAFGLITKVYDIIVGEDDEDASDDSTDDSESME